jgi:hypothetical protein
MPTVKEKEIWNICVTSVNKDYFIRKFNCFCALSSSCRYSSEIKKKTTLIVLISLLTETFNK